MHPAPYAPTGRMFKQRSAVLVWLIWPLITLGIYSFVWYYKIHKEMAEFHRKPDSPVAGPLLVLIFLSWTVVGYFWTFFNTGKRIVYAQRRAGIQDTCSPAVGTLLMLVFGLGILYYQMQLNRIPERYNVSEGAEVQLLPE
nr:DUF4234 domain-containing protein [Kibdelosporangium sp. MJ126-NF4]CEL19220.1 Basic proline-rich protein precursor [Kibdelosporangium sp. MJ126-NF4]CTQ94980.1 Basic proline-rich protein precursor [Kibdelosporangium sp. MJ126-NF4]